MELKILSFNIRAHDDKNGNSVSERAPRLYSIVEPLNADIIGYQEFSPKWEEHVNKYLENGYDMFNKYRSETFSPESCPIFWRKDKFSCVKTGCFWLSDTPEVESRGWDERYNCYRICEYVVLKEKQTQSNFVVMNTHFGFGDKGQVASAQLIYDYYKKISDYPTIIVGDFNMKPDSQGYEKMSELFTDVNAVTAKDTRATYHGYDPEKHQEGQIDYCFITSDITPVDQEIIDTLVDGKFPSDHYGLKTIVDCPL